MIDTARLNAYRLQLPAGCIMIMELWPVPNGLWNDSKMSLHVTYRRQKNSSLYSMHVSVLLGWLGAL